MDKAFFLASDEVRAVAREFGTPVYVYDQATLERHAADVLGFPNAYGLTVRYAMKALPTGAIVRLFAGLGIDIDASSGFECERALRLGVPPERIQITAQQLPSNLEDLVRRGVLFNACSLHQLAAYGRLFPGTEVSIRVNPGLGTGHSNRTNTGGPSASFGIWHEHLDQVAATLREHDLRLTRLHSHIGSGSDPEMWAHCAKLTLDIAARLPEVTRVSLGGGFKIARMPGEVAADLGRIGAAIKQDFERFHAQHGRKLHLEIEPGTYLVALAGLIIATAVDLVDTGAQGYRFIKTDTGMTEVTRPALYGAQHPIALVPGDGADGRATGEYLVVGHCCESGDILTPAPGNPEELQPRTLTEARIGDLIVIGGAGAYCSGMSTKNYNSFPEAAEVLMTRDRVPELIRRRQTLEQMMANEV